MSMDEIKNKIIKRMNEFKKISEHRRLNDYELGQYDALIYILWDIKAYENE